jgi:hypothetical protein
MMCLPSRGLNIVAAAFLPKLITKNDFQTGAFLPPPRSEDMTGCHYMEAGSVTAM